MEDFQDFYERTYRLVVGQVYLLTGDLHEAEDIAQEALTRAASHWERLRGHQSPLAWVRRVALNLATDAARRARRRMAALTRLGASTATAPRLWDDELTLMAALRRLPLRYREVLVLHYLLDLPVSQIAAQLAVPAGTVKARLSRGRAALEAQLTGGDPARAAGTGLEPTKEAR